MQLKVFEEYIRQGEPSRVEKAQNWQTAIGLQQVDGLKPSAYLIEQAKQNIEGDITIDEVKKRIDEYYKTQTVRQFDDNDRTEEADKVSSRIAEILSEKTFSFTPLWYINIHRRLFTGIYKFAGKIRDYNITKNEWVLDGQTVLYSDSYMIKATLDYDFGQEKAFSYKNLSQIEIVEHIAKFISGLWQIHAFGEGNTRTTAIFTIKYLQTFGFKANNDMFASHSWYFRNALVRANFNDAKHNIHATTEFLMQFFGNLLFDENNELKNRYLHIKFVASEKPDNLKINEQKFSVNTEKFPVIDEKFSVKFSVNQEKILALMQEMPTITVNEIAAKLGITERAIHKNIVKLKERGILTRIGADKNGYWKIMIND
ncbi:MAG: Fic family protein [Prevotellaceae bacterium]|jgi:fido (protein-threonine AMPylation protein)/biotin operon repressor|nr:Fic family protein [Prevotellaceae bacterium]